MNEPRWLTCMRAYEGLTEIPGPETNPTIWRWLGMVQAQFLGGDDAPWCGSGLGGIMLEVGIQPPRQCYRALNWATWGSALSGPALGAVGVLKRPGGGHVTLVVGIDANGNILGLGGNQRDGVRVSPFNPSRFVAWRWPPGFPVVGLQQPPRFASAEAASLNEA